MSFACYCLVSEKGTTYVGFSVDVDRRLRQHNGEITGGAKATHGHSWKRMCTVAGFPSQQSALQFEWKWKYLSRKVKGCSAVERRCVALVELLNSDKSTSNALPFATYDGPLSVLLEHPCVEKLRDKELCYGVILE